jgi:hypothetical protein
VPVREEGHEGREGRCRQSEGKQRGVGVEDVEGDVNVEGSRAGLGHLKRPRWQWGWSMSIVKGFVCYVRFC